MAETSSTFLMDDARVGDDYEGDQPVADFDTMTVIDAVIACKNESEEARAERDRRNKINYDVAHCRQNTSNKVEGQSTEFLPKTAMAAEQLRAFIKNGLVAFGNWFQVELDPNPALFAAPGQPTTTLTASGITKLLKHRLESPEQIPPGCQDFPTTVSDAIYTGAFASLMVLKVHGLKVPTRSLSVNFTPMERAYTDPMNGEQFTGVETEEELVLTEGSVWRLLIELIRPEDYFPDPTGRGLYEIHRTRKDLYQVIDGAEDLGYDLDVVTALADSYSNPELETDIERETAQSSSIRPIWRKEVELLEFWGTILDSDGHVAHRNCRCVVANDRFLLLRPEPNPFWHQESPFVVAPLIRVPFSVFHKALFDDGVRLNLAANEIFNLMLDGALAAVWGNKQVHADLVANMDDFQGGIPQGAVFITKPEAQQGVPVVMQLDTGTVPKESEAMFRMVDSEFQLATKINSIQLGQIPKKDVRATEVSISEQNNDQYFSSMIGDIERELIVKTLRLAWLTMLQNCDDWMAEDVVGCIGPEAARNLALMSPAKRYMTYAQGTRFKVNGLSMTLGRSREFQKIIATLTVLSQSPMLLQAFMMDSSPKKLLYHLYTALNIDPEDIKMTEEEAATLQQRVTEMSLFQGMSGGGGQAQGMAQQQPGSPQQSIQAGADRMQQPPQEL